MQEYVAASCICGDEAKASFPYPTVDLSILEAAGGTILVAGLVRERSAGRRGEFWALVWNHGGRFAQPFARYDWAREWTGYGDRQTRSFRSIFDRRQGEGGWGDGRRRRGGTG